jgi:transposase-like protein
MARRGPRDRGKERYWRRVLRQWRRSGQGVRSYCVENGLSEALFYAWRRTIQERDRQEELGPAVRDDRECSAPPAFVPLTIAPAAATPLEVVLAHGRVVRIAPGFDPATLGQLLAVLDEERSC